jgi:integrative and conjugative element protein (TIGR02256 family)
VSVDAASGPPPDSLLSSVYFDHGTLGTQETVDYYRERSVGATGFVGIWHTHPYGRAWPSGTDKNGMAEILSVADSGPRAIMFILGGQDSEWADFVQTGEQPRLYAEVVERPVSRPFNAPVGGLPVGVTFYSGGYGYVPAHPMGGPARKGNGGDR